MAHNLTVWDRVLLKHERFLREAGNHFCVCVCVFLACFHVLFSGLLLPLFVGMMTSIEIHVDK